MRRTLCATVYERFQALWIFWVNHPHSQRIDPPTSFNAVQAANNDFELHVVFLIFVLDLPYKWSDLDTFHTLLDKGCSNLSLRFTNINLTKQELAIQV